MSESTTKSALFDVIVQCRKESPDQTAFLYYDDKRNLCRRTHEDVFQKVCACREYYYSGNARRIGILGTNSWEMICNAWGMLAAGAAVAFLDPQLPMEDLIYAIRKTDLEMLVRESDLEILGKEVQKQLPQICVSGYCDSKFSGKTCGENWKEGDAIFFTSGTSKNSKAVVTPTISIRGEFSVHKNMIEHESGEIALIPLPLHHSFGFTVLNFYYEANCPVFISSMKTLLRDVKLVQPRMIALVPSAVEFLLKKKAFPSRLRYLLVSGSHCSVELAARVREQGMIIQNRYGSSEIPCAIGENLPQDEVDTLTIHDYIDVEIAEDGEVIVLAPYHFAEYYKNSEETSEVLSEGKIHTGDIGYLDDNGKLHLLGRRKNMILMENGDKIFCPDLDEALSDLQGVNEAAVIYINKKLIAVINPKDKVSRQQIEAEVAKYNQGQPYQRRIQKVWIRNERMPYTSSGKLKRRILEAEYEENYMKE